MPKIRKSPTGLKPKQLAAIAILSKIPQEFSSMQQVADDPSVGVNRDTLYEWFKKDLFLERLEEESQRNFRAHAGVVRAAHFKGILKRQDARLIDLFYQRQEGWRPQSGVEHSGKIGLPILGNVKKQNAIHKNNSNRKNIKVIKKNLGVAGGDIGKQDNLGSADSD